MKFITTYIRLLVYKTEGSINQILMKKDEVPLFEGPTLGALPPTASG